MPHEFEPADPALLGEASEGEPIRDATPDAGLTSNGGDGWEPPAIEDVAHLFPHYEVRAVLGRGDLGAVYQARQIALDRLVAIKLLPLEMSSDEAFAERFRKEARAMARFSHPNIVAVYDFGTTAAGHLFIVMENVEGATLSDIIHRPTEVVAGITDPGYYLAPEQALSFVEQISGALGFAHARGIVHRGLKPACVLIDTEGQAKVTNFGLSTRRGEGSAAAVVDTPGYMAPEQVNGTGGDRRTDIYRLGVMLYEMLCREVPGEVFVPPSVRSGCDTRVDAIIRQAIQQAPERRYQSVQEMQAACAGVRAALTAPSSVPPLNRPAPPPHVASSAPVAPAKSKVPLYAGLTVAVAGLAWAYAHFTQPTRHAGSTDAKIPPPALPAVPAETNPASIAPPPAELPSGDATAENSTAPAVPSSENPTASPHPQNAVEKWLAEVDGPRQAAFKKQVTEPFAAGVEELRSRYLATLTAGQAKAAATGDLDRVLIWQNERELFEKAQTVWPDDASTPDVIRPLRADFRQRLAQLESKRANNAKPLYSSYDAILLRNLTLLTQRGRIEDARLLQNKREEIARSWLETPVTGQLPDSLTLLAESLALNPAESKPANNEWVDLFSRLTPAIVEKAGHGWRLENGVLLSPAKKYSALPLPGDLHGTSYQVRVKLRQIATARETLFLGLPAGDRMVGFDLDGWPDSGRLTVISLVDGTWGNKLPGATAGKQVKDFELHDLEVSVRLAASNVTITTTLDGYPLYEWSGPTASLSMDSNWVAKIPSGTLALGAFTDDWEVSELKVKRLGK